MYSDKKTQGMIYDATVTMTVTHTYHTWCTHAVHCHEHAQKTGRAPGAAPDSLAACPSAYVTEFCFSDMTWPLHICCNHPMQRGPSQTTGDHSLAASTHNSWTVSNAQQAA
jgi:hypothetical protein